MTTKPNLSGTTKRSWGATIIDAFKVGGMPLAIVVCGALTIALSAELTKLAWLCLVIGLLLVLVGVGVSVWGQARQFGPFIDFNKKLEGWWWERIRPDDSAAISLVRIEPNATIGTLRLYGRVFDKNGNFLANWDSVDSCVNPTTAKLFYYWTGRSRQVGSEPQNGFGEAVFGFPTEGLASAHGTYSDIGLVKGGKMATKATELRPASQEDVAVVFGNNAESTKTLVLDKIKKFG